MIKKMKSIHVSSLMGEDYIRAVISDIDLKSEINRPCSFKTALLELMKEYEDCRANHIDRLTVRFIYDCLNCLEIVLTGIKDKY